MSVPRFQEARTRTFQAEVDLSAKQFFAVIEGTAAGEINLAGAGTGFAILMNKPKLGESAEVAMAGGGALGVSGAAVAKGAWVASDAAGKLVTAVATDSVIGRALSSTAGADVHFEIERVNFVL